MPGNRRMDVRERFMRHVQIQPNGCHVWTGGTNGKAGYGQFYTGYVNGRRLKKYAHRLAYEWAKGPIPEGLVIDHLCRNPPCVNPAHLEVVTEQQNIMRGRGMNPYCQKGLHLRTPESSGTNRGSDGLFRPYCLECKRERRESRYDDKDHATRCAKGHLLTDRTSFTKVIANGRTRRYCQICWDSPTRRKTPPRGRG